MSVLNLNLASACLSSEGRRTCYLRYFEPDSSRSSVEDLQLCVQSQPIATGQNVITTSRCLICPVQGRTSLLIRRFSYLHSEGLCCLQQGLCCPQQGLVAFNKALSSSTEDLSAPKRLFFQRTSPRTVGRFDPAGTLEHWNS